MTATGPTYDLSEIQTKVRAGLYWITSSARQGAAAAGLAETDIVACVLSLTAADFYKTMEAEAAQGLWQDVYRPAYGRPAVDLYVKLQLAQDGDAVVISFKAR